MHINIEQKVKTKMLQVQNEKSFRIVSATTMPLAHLHLRENQNWILNLSHNQHKELACPIIPQPMPFFPPQGEDLIMQSKSINLEAVKHHALPPTSPHIGRYAYSTWINNQSCMWTSSYLKSRNWQPINGGKCQASTNLKHPSHAKLTMQWV